MILKGFKFICFGNSVDNLKMAIEYGIIGLAKRHSFTTGERIYFVIKSENEWKVCGRAEAGDETDLNPYGKYYTYTVSHFEACIPFSINEKSRQILGIYWGLNFQTPRTINNSEYVQYIERSFKQCNNKEMLQTLES